MWTALLFLFLCGIPLLCAATGVFFVIATDKAEKRVVASKNTYKKKLGHDVPFIIGIFHPYCDAGGGGERVLWTAIRALQSKYPTSVIALYTGDENVTKEAMLRKTKTRFNIDVRAETLDVIYLTRRRWVEDKRYPRFTLLGQSLGSVLLGWEALTLKTPDIFLDTMGYAFTYPVASLLFGCKVGAYVHYPTISSDMLEGVQSRAAGVTNSSAIARSYVLSRGKLFYYRRFAELYGSVGSFADVVMVNSSWTKGHIDQLWRKNTAVVYPPCDTAAFQDFDLENRKPIIVSVAQFRPEKNHDLQLASLARFFHLRPDRKTGPDAVKLDLVGSVRGPEDEARVEALKKRCKELDIVENVEFVVNASFDELRKRLAAASVGLHTMWNEHFGIGVVEYMSSGIIPLAHNSGGPKMDIVKDDGDDNPVGYLASTAEEFAESLRKIFDLPNDRLQAMRNSARRTACARFSESTFDRSCVEYLNRLFY